VGAVAPKRDGTGKKRGEKAPKQVNVGRNCCQWVQNGYGWFKNASRLKMGVGGFSS
jgi:hypothetical protein